MKERRNQKRRKNPRVLEPLSIVVFWEAKGVRREAFIYDLSEGGCYLNTNHLAKRDEAVVVEVPAPSSPERVIRLTGTVVSQDRRLKGFGVRFNALTPEQRGAIAAFLKDTRQAERRSES